MLQTANNREKSPQQDMHN